jgi:hypothetical protein
MGIKLVRSRKRFIVETGKEEEILENARTYFGEASTLLNVGLGYKISKRNASSFFNKIKRGKNLDMGVSLSSISIRDWKRTKEYASRADRGERYDPETFVRPEF